MRKQIDTMNDQGARLRWPRAVHVALGTTILAGAVALDFSTGPELTSTIFYLIPVTYFALTLGSVAAYASAISSALLWVLSDFFSASAGRQPAVPYWNALTQALVFILISYVLHRLREELHSQRQANAALRRANQEVIRLSKMKADFCATASHELRTPMATLREGLRLLDDDLPASTPTEAKAYLRMAQKNVERLIALVNKLLDFSQAQETGHSPDLELCDVNALIRQTAAFMQPLADKQGLNLRLDLTNEVPAVWCDAGAVTRILGNLLGNALKFTRTGSVTLHSQANAHDVIVAVQDTGCGVPPDALERIFEPFQRIADDGQTPAAGSGLGLSISRALVRSHGGRIWADSTVGHGTTVRFTLPFRPAPAGPKQEGDNRLENRPDR